MQNKGIPGDTGAGRGEISDNVSISSGNCSLLISAFITSMQILRIPPAGRIFFRRTEKSCVFPIRKNAEILQIFFYTSLNCLDIFTTLP